MGRIIATCVIAFTALIQGCPRDVDDPVHDGVGTNDLIIGLIQPQASGSELAREQAARLAVREINAAGGVNGQRVSLLVVFDDDNDPQVGVNAAQQLVARNAVAIVGANSSRVTLPVAEQVTIPAGIALVAHGATSPLISELADNDTVYRIPPSDALQGRLLAEQIWQEGFTRAAVFSQDEPYGIGLRDTFNSYFASLGGSIIADAVAPADKTGNFDSEIDTLYSVGTPDALVVFAFAESTSNLLREVLTSRGALPPLFGVDSNMISAMLENAPVQIAGMRGTIPGAALDRPEYLAFAARFEAATGIPVTDPNVGNTYDGVYLIALALAQGGSNDRATVIDHLRAVSIADTPTPVTIAPGQIGTGFAAIANGDDVDYQGVANDIDFDAQGDPTASTYQYVEVIVSDGQLDLRVRDTIDYP